MGNVVELSDDNFDAEVLQANEPVLVDFWAPWCGPCRQVAPMVEALAAENAGAAKVVKVNVDDCPRAAQSYRIQSIPTLIVFKDGKVVNQFVGIGSKNQIQEALDGAKT